MKQINTPQVKSESQKKALKIVLLNAQRSASIGLILLVLPFVFVVSNIFSYQLGIDLGPIRIFTDWIASLDQTPVINWIVRFLLLGGPAVAILINILAITHVFHDHKSKELVVTLKLRWVNLSIVVLCLSILAIFVLYLVVENV